MLKKQPLITIMYPLADGMEIQIQVTLEVAAVLDEAARRERALLKQDKRNIDLTELEKSDGKLLCPPEMVEDMICRFDGYERLRMAIEGLTETQRRRIAASYFSGLTYTQIARNEGVNESAVRRSIRSALEKLKNFLRETSDFGK